MKGENNMSNKDIYKEIFSEYPDVVNIEQMCQMLGGICSKSAYKLLEENRIKHFTIGRKYLIPKIHIMSFLGLIENS